MSKHEHEIYMVQYRKSADTKMLFRCCETIEEAERLVTDLRAKGYYATCWRL